MYPITTTIEPQAALSARKMRVSDVLDLKAVGTQSDVTTHVRINCAKRARFIPYASSSDNGLNAQKSGVSPSGAL